MRRFFTPCPSLALLGSADRAFIPSIKLGMVIVLLAFQRASASIPSLKMPFTFVYKVVARDVRSKEVMAEERAEQFENYRRRVKANTMSPQQMADLIATAPKDFTQDATASETITLSFNGSKLLFIRGKPEEADINPTGAKFAILSRDGDFVRTGSDAAMELSKPSTFGIERIPIVGPSLPFLPITAEDKVLSTLAYSVNGLPYQPGQVISSSLGSDWKIRRILLFGPNHELAGQYDFHSYKSFRGQSIVNSATLTMLHNGKAPKLKGSPERRIEYELVQSDSKPMSDGAFRPENYLEEGENLTCRFEGHDVGIRYRHSGGSFVQQAQEQKLAEEIASERHVRSSSYAAPAGIATFLFLIGLGVWHSKNGRRQTL